MAKDSGLQKQNEFAFQLKWKLVDGPYNPTKLFASWLHLFELKLSWPVVRGRGDSYILLTQERSSYFTSVVTLTLEVFCS
jgi:hypothetical protein